MCASSSATHQPITADSALLAYCTARERLRRAEAASKDDRAEQLDAERTLRGLLTDSMQRHAVSCMTVPGPGDGSARYVRLAPPTRRSCKLTCVDDALSLVDGVARQLTEVALQDLPKATVALVRDRARERGPPPGPPRLTLVSRASTASSRGTTSATVDLVHAPSETRNLVTQYLEARVERDAGRAALKPLRAQRKQAEEALLPMLQEPATVRMARGDKECTMRIERVAPPEEPTGGDEGTHPDRRPLGIRAVLGFVRDASEHAIATAERGRFEAVLKDRFRELLLGAPSGRSATPRAPRIRVRAMG